MEVGKKIVNILLIILTIIAMIAIGLFAYFKLFIKETTVGINYISDQAPVDILEIKDKQELSEAEIEYYENRYLFHANVLDNANKNGEELYEMKLNYFTDYSLEHTACRSTGMQHLGSYNLVFGNSKTEEEIQEYVNSGFTYYDTTNMTTWNGGNLATQLNRNAKLIIKIDNKPYQIQLTGTTTSTEGWLIKYEVTYYYFWAAVFGDVMNAVKTNSRGYGDYYITLNLSKYFTVYAFDEAKGKFVEDNITDQIFNYAVLKFHYEANGVTRASQSLFGQINCNSKYGEDTSIDTTYWQERIVYTLTEKDLLFRTSEVYEGEVAYLSVATKETLSKMPRAEINIKIDVNSSYFTDNEINFIGFDFNAFEGVTLNKITLTGSKTINFLDNSLKDTKLKKLEHESTILLNIEENAINSEFEEVIL